MTTTTEDKTKLKNGVPKTEPNGTAQIDKRKEKNKLKKKKKKQNKQQKKQEKITGEEIKKENQSQDVEIEYVEVNPLDGLDENDPAFAEFSEIFEKFKEAAQAEAQSYQQDDITGKQEAQDGTTENAQSDDDENEKKGASNKQKKKQRRLSLAVLKQLVKRPDLVESWDVTSADPILLVYLKGYKNVVPVPVHWSQKRKYLQGKRGVEKPPFQLPEFIENTGVSKLRKGTTNAQKSLKQKQREKMNAKVGRMEFDYQVLHDAFFKYQTKPKLTKHGDLYYEGKEFEITLREKRPGVLSEELKRALGMPEGAPPPWLFNMQRFGPPPSYPNLKIPGVNAPLPEGARYGYHPGGWGKPPVDEFNRPLYGDVFGTAPEPPPEITQPIERRHWGEIEVEEEEAMEQEMEEQPQEGEDEEPHPSGFETPSGLETPSGMETPETIELRKAPLPPPPKKPAEPEDDTDKQLFQVIREQEVSVGSGTMYGSSHRYVVPPKGAANKVDLMKSQATEKLDLSLNPAEVENMEELTEELLAKKYEAARQEKKDSERKEDVTDLVKEQLQKKRKKKDGSDDKKAKKYKEFKF